MKNNQHHKISKAPILCFIFFIFITSCTTNEEVFTRNKQLLTEVDKYISYANKLPKDFYDPDKSFILILVKKTKLDTISVILSFDEYVGGIIKPYDTIIGFFNYNKNHILIQGDYPNSLIDIKRKFNKETQHEILNKYFYEEYHSYLKDPTSIMPKWIDNMTVHMEFDTLGKIVNIERM